MEATSRVGRDKMRRDLQVLIAAVDSQTVAATASQIVTRLSANITIVDSLEEARVLIASEAYDVVLTTRTLRDGSGFALIKSLGTPVVLLSDTDDAARTVEAFRAGAADVICVSGDATESIGRIERVIRNGRRQRHTLHRNRRLRRVSKRLIRDRRELRQRVDLICRDVVEAYQRLAEKVVTDGVEG